MLAGASPSSSSSRLRRPDAGAAAADKGVTPAGEEDNAASTAAGISRKAARRVLHQLEYAVMKTRVSKAARMSHVPPGKWQKSAAALLKMCPPTAFRQAVKKALC